MSKFQKNSGIGVSRVKRLEQTILLAQNAISTLKRRPVTIYDRHGDGVTLEPKQHKDRRPLTLWCSAAIKYYEVVDLAMDKDEMLVAERQLEKLKELYKKTKHWSTFCNSVSVETINDFMHAVFAEGRTWTSIERNFDLRPSSGNNAVRASAEFCKQAKKGFLDPILWVSATKESIKNFPKIFLDENYKLTKMQQGKIVSRYERLSEMGFCEPYDELLETILEP